MSNNLTAWLYQVTRNKIVDYYRTKKTFDELSEGLVADDVDESVRVDTF